VGFGVGTPFATCEIYKREFSKKPTRVGATENDLTDGMRAGGRIIGLRRMGGSASELTTEISETCSFSEVLLLQQSTYRFPFATI
jgi:hypothetical protein